MKKTDYSTPRLSYTSPRLTFKRDEIEALNDDDIFRVFVRNDEGYYTMSKKEFYDVFENVTQSRSYLEIGNYNYPTTPHKALQFFKHK